MERVNVSVCAHTHIDLICLLGKGKWKTLCFFLTLGEIVLVSEVPRSGSHNFVQCFVHWKVKDGVHYSLLLKKINRFILK